VLPLLAGCSPSLQSLRLFRCPHYGFLSAQPMLKTRFLTGFELVGITRYYFLSLSVLPSSNTPINIMSACVEVYALFVCKLSMA
jgi:hypothetical protein